MRHAGAAIWIASNAQCGVFSACSVSSLTAGASPQRRTACRRHKVGVCKQAVLGEGQQMSAGRQVGVVVVVGGYRMERQVAGAGIRSNSMCVTSGRDLLGLHHISVPSSVQACNKRQGGVGGGGGGWPRDRPRAQRSANRSKVPCPCWNPGKRQKHLWRSLAGSAVFADRKAGEFVQ